MFCSKMITEYDDNEYEGDIIRLRIGVRIEFGESGSISGLGGRL